MRSQSQIKHEKNLQANELEWKEIIGSGGYSTIYQGVWKNKDVAIKVLKPALDSSSFEEEKNIMFALTELAKSNPHSHSHIVKLYGVIENAKNRGLVMEYMPDGNLRQYIKIERDIFRLDRIALDIALGLLFLHENEFIHRDIKPDNIMLKSHRAKIADFGLSIRNHNKTNILEGTAHYIAPELMEESEHSQYSNKSDMYAYAFVLYEMYTGKRPWPLDWVPYEVMARVLREQERPTIPQDKTIASGIEDLMNESWAQAPEKRPCAKEAVTKLSAIIKAHKKLEQLAENKNITTVYAGFHANSLFAVFPKNVVDQIATNMHELDKNEKKRRLIIK